MKLMSSFRKLIGWLASPEVFGSITKKIPGKWHLFEYYYDLNDDLVHVEEVAPTDEGDFLELILSEDRKFSSNCQLPITVFKVKTTGNWSVQRNFITLVDPLDFRNNLEFQFAFEKETLKLLKKDKLGKIEFFGFFKNDEKKSAAR